VFCLSVHILTRAALLLALTLLFQSLRVIIPLPAAFSTFLIGSLMNACLLVALLTVGLWPALLIAVMIPLAAYLQALLPLPVFVFPVAIGNVLYILFFKLLAANWREWQAIAAAALGKMLWLYFSFFFLLSFLSLPAKMSAVLLMIMSWPQFVTGSIGGAVAIIIRKRMKFLGK
jgi:hypothetical protein